MSNCITGSQAGFKNFRSNIKEEGKLSYRSSSSRFRVQESMDHFISTGKEQSPQNRKSPHRVIDGGFPQSKALFGLADYRNNNLVLTLGVQTGVANQMAGALGNALAAAHAL